MMMLVEALPSQNLGPPPAFREPRHRRLARLSIDAPTGDARALKMRPTTTPSASTSKSSSFQSPDGRFALARLKGVRPRRFAVYRRPHSDAVGLLAQVRTEELILVRCRYRGDSKERSIMANNKNPNQKQPGEKEPGKFHYNLGNMSGKTIDICKAGSDRKKHDAAGRCDANAKPISLVSWRPVAASSTSHS
jgi:hypothetical protein